MKHLLLATTALVIAGQAFAADMRLPVKAPPAAVPAYSWTGCYGGAHVGVGWGRTDITEPAEPAFFGSQFFAPANSPVPVDTGANVLGGVQLGCDYQFATHWVIGAAGDFSWTNLEGHADVADPILGGKGPITLNSQTEWLATATARLGYAWDRWMFYGKGGAAWEHDKQSLQNLFFFGNPMPVLCTNAAFAVASCNPSGSETRLGWTVGFGAEWAVTNHWSTSVEFDHYDFGSHTLNLTDPGIGIAFLNGAVIAASGPITVKERVEALKIGINYRFGGP
jgi:outer membrane immunogenic protein